MSNNLWNQLKSCFFMNLLHNLNMETLLSILGYFSSFIFTFGVMSEGVKRKQIRKVGLLATLGILVLAVIYSLITQNLFVIGLLIDVVLVFLISLVVLKLVFKYILKIYPY